MPACQPWKGKPEDTAQYTNKLPRVPQKVWGFLAHENRALTRVFISGLGGSYSHCGSDIYERPFERTLRLLPIHHALTHFWVFPSKSPSLRLWVLRHPKGICGIFYNFLFLWFGLSGQRRPLPHSTACCLACFHCCPPCSHSAHLLPASFSRLFHFAVSQHQCNNLICFFSAVCIWQTAIVSSCFFKHEKQKHPYLFFNIVWFLILYSSLYKIMTEHVLKLKNCLRISFMHIMYFDEIIFLSCPLPKCYQSFPLSK